MYCKVMQNVPAAPCAIIRHSQGNKVPPLGATHSLAAFYLVTGCIPQPHLAIYFIPILLVCYLALQFQTVYLDFAQHFPDQLQEVVDLMTEKGLHLRTPLEELDLLIDRQVANQEPDQKSAAGQMAEPHQRLLARDFVSGEAGNVAGNVPT